MIRGIVLAGVIAWVVVAGPALGHGQTGDIRASELAYYNNLLSLKSSIAEGWLPAQVVAIMGVPDRQGTRLDGPDLVEVWGYRGYEVLIEFRNGLVSNWFFRFER
jgi:hypothetical protein